MTDPVCPFHQEPTPARFAVVYAVRGVGYVDHACGLHVDQVSASLSGGADVEVREVRDVAPELPGRPVLEPADLLDLLARA